MVRDIPVQDPSSAHLQDHEDVAQVDVAVTATKKSQANTAWA
jgi:hypothetical protein